jgi:polar amino acid transport system substrate-binding protein
VKRAIGFRLGCGAALLFALFQPVRLQAQPAGSSLARIKTQGVLRWGADPNGGAPFVFANPDAPDEIVGFEVELMERLARHLGVKAELVRGEWEGLIDNMKANRTDLVLNGLEVTEERAKEVAFTVPYFQFVQQITIRLENQHAYRTLADLKGKKVAVLSGSASVDVLKSEGWKEDDIVPFDDSIKPMEALKQGRVTAVLCESIIARYYAGSDPDLFNVPQTFSPGTYAAALRLGDEELLAEINRVLNEMKKSGELGELYQRWGIWSDRQEKLGVVKGSEQDEIPLARPPVRLTGDRLLRTGLALLRGAGTTLLLTAISMPLALAVGLVLALMVRSGSRLLAWPATLYIQVMRGTPLLVQMYVIYFSLPRLGRLPVVSEVLQYWDMPNLFTFPAFVVGVICLSANYAAYEAEIHRAGLDAVPKGQREAALSLGMSERQAFFHVVLPQSFRIILPPVFNDLISMLKDSSLVSVMGVAELLYVASTTGKATFLYAQMLLAAALLYLVMSLVADWLGKRLEARMKHRGMPQVSYQPARH